MAWLFAVAMLAAVGCSDLGGASRLAEEALADRGRQGAVCPGGGTEVWGYGSVTAFLPAPAGPPQLLSGSDPFRAAYPFWCESPERGTLKGKVKIAVSKVDGKFVVDEFAVADIAPLPLSEQTWEWLLTFLGAQLIMFVYFFNSLDWTWRTRLTALVAMPIGGYLSYRAFNSVGAISVCLLAQAILGAALYGLARVISNRNG